MDNDIFVRPYFIYLRIFHLLIFFYTFYTGPFRWLKTFCGTIFYISTYFPSPHIFFHNLYGTIREWVKTFLRDHIFLYMTLYWGGGGEGLFAGTTFPSAHIFLHILNGTLYLLIFFDTFYTALFRGGG